MNGIQLREIQETSEYLEILVRIPKTKMVGKIETLTEDDALEIARRGMREFYAGEAKEWKGLKAFLEEEG